MWQEIRLRSLGVIDSAELDLDPGLTVITGETGAGKTMVVTALGLLRGERSDAGLVRHGDSRTRVEGVVDVGSLPEVGRALEDTPAEVDDGVLVISRTVTGGGRSRAFAGGAVVPVSTLGRISDHLVAVHGQSAQHRLLRPSAQLAVLDQFAGSELDELLAEYRPAYLRYRETERRLNELTGRAQERARELDQLQHGLREIEALAPQEGEDEALAAEIEVLGHADALARAATGAHALLSADGAEALDGADV